MDEDMADSMVDVPAKDIKSKDDTTEVLGESVCKSGVEDMEELEGEDPFMEQPTEDLEKTEAVLSSPDMSDFDGMLDANEVLYHHACLLRPATLHACLLRPPPFTRACFARHPSRVLASPATLHACLLRPPPFTRSCFARHPSRVLASPPPFTRSCFAPPPFAYSCFAGRDCNRP
jgi:hypothetical protein